MWIYSKTFSYRKWSWVGVQHRTGKGWTMVCFPLRRTNVITLWVWNMHECLQQFKQLAEMQTWWRFLGSLAFVCVFNRKCSQHGDRVCLALLRSRWAGLVGMWCCDSTGTIQAICRTAHHPLLGLSLQWTATHALTPVWRTRVCPPSMQSSSRYQEYIISCR